MHSLTLTPAGPPYQFTHFPIVFARRRQQREKNKMEKYSSDRLRGLVSGVCPFLSYTRRFAVSNWKSIGALNSMYSLLFIKYTNLKFRQRAKQDANTIAATVCRTLHETRNTIDACALRRPDQAQKKYFKCHLTRQNKRHDERSTKVMRTKTASLSF